MAWDLEPKSKVWHGHVSIRKHEPNVQPQIRCDKRLWVAQLTGLAPRES